MLLTKYVEVSWNVKNKNHYIGLGYEFTGINKRFVVPVEHLMKNSNVKLQVKCDFCGTEFTTTFQHFRKSSELSPSLVCTSCGGKKLAMQTLQPYWDMNNIEKILHEKLISHKDIV